MPEHDILCNGWDVPITDCPEGSWGRPCSTLEPHGPHDYRVAPIQMPTGQTITELWCPGRCDGSCASEAADA